MTAMPTTVLNLDEAAAYLRVTSDVLRLEAEAGRTPGRRLGGDWRFTENALSLWLATPNPPQVNGHYMPQGEWNAETEREAEEFIAQMAAYRKSFGVLLSKRTNRRNDLSHRGELGEVSGN